MEILQEYTSNIEHLFDSEASWEELTFVIHMANEWSFEILACVAKEAFVAWSVHGPASSKIAQASPHMPEQLRSDCIRGMQQGLSAKASIQHGKWFFVKCNRYVRRAYLGNASYRKMQCSLNVKLHLDLWNAVVFTAFL